ncbi:MAG: M24 family metallopeptidase, partial [Bacteroidales bacterium]|nr:M24 family metallopeptidase [Bacteroidales bacterium]
QRECYDAVLQVFQEGKQLFKQGNTIREINKSVQSMMEKQMIKLGLFTHLELKKQDTASPLFRKYLMHGVTHFVGLDVHDVGCPYEKLKKGMVLTFEPALYIDNENIAIRIENDLVVTDDGPIDLMEDIPVLPDEIEDMMHS